MQEFDLVVIGGGPGGYVAAITAAKSGLKTLIIEKAEMGGTCLNRGCIPTKALLHCTGEYNAAKNSEACVCKGIELDYSKAFAHKEATTMKLRRGVEMLVKKSGCTIINGTAELQNENMLKVNDETISFVNLIIATGSVPSGSPFEIEDGANVINSDGFLELKELPESAVIIGGGVIGMEFATVMANAGKDVTVIEAATEVLPSMDKELAAVSKMALEKQGVKFHTQTFVKKVYTKDGKTICDITCGDNSDTVSADVVISAVGRKANTEGLKPERAALRMNRGFIEVNELCATSTPHIYAIGDVNGKCMLAHAASYQGKRVVLNIVENKNISCTTVPVPGCVYTSPEIASVGMTEEEAVSAGYNIKVGRFDAIGNGKLLSMGETLGFVKLIGDAETDEILGAQLACAHATDMVEEIAAVMKCEGTMHELSETIHPHPTVSEMLMEAADDYFGMCVHK